MTKFFIVVLTILAAQRLQELYLARKHTLLMRQEGAIEFGANHYPWMVFFHASWFLATITEFMVNNRLVWPPQAAYCLAFWLVAQPLRYWAIFSLGKFWNTRILILPGSKPIHQGPYQFIKHPNYLVVAIELLCIPLAFGLYYTAIFATLGNALIMWVRIPAEKQALSQL